MEYFEDQYVKAIQPADVRAYVKYLSGRGYAYKTVAHHLSVLRLILDYAVEHDIIQANPATGITVPKRLPRNPREMPSDTDLLLIQSNAENGIMGRAAFFALYTGCRSGELFALQYKDIDREAKLLTISKSVYYVGKTPHIKQPKTAAGIRTVPLPQLLLDRIPDGPPNNYLFSVDGKSPISDSVRRNGWTKFQKEAGISAHCISSGTPTLRCCMSREWTKRPPRN